MKPGSGYVGGPRVAKLGEQRARLGLDVRELLRSQLLAPAADRGVTETVHRAMRRRHVRAEELGEPVGDAGELFVADLQQAVAGTGGAYGLDVSPPRPGAALRVARLREFLAPLRLDPEARLRPVREPGIVPAFRVGVEPAAFEQRAHDVAAVAYGVHRERLRIGLQGGADHVRGLGRLLDAA